jgi:hypothetical protein
MNLVKKYFCMAAMVACVMAYVNLWFYFLPIVMGKVAHIQMQPVSHWVVWATEFVAIVLMPYRTVMEGVGCCSKK